MEIENNSVEFQTGGENPWATGTYSPKVKVTDIDINPKPLIKEADEFENGDGNDDFEEPTPADGQNPIDEKVVADLEEGDENDSADNIHAKITAQKLKEEGYLNVDEIPDDIDYPQIYDLYKDSVKERLIQEVQEEVNQNLQVLGINENNISILNALENNIPLDEISEISRFKKYVGLNPADVAEDIKLSVIKDRYQAIGLGDKDLERQITAIESSGEVDEAFQESQQFFKGVVSEFDKTQAALAQEALRRDYEMKQKNQLILDKALKLGELGGSKLTVEQQKDLQKAIYDRNIILDIEDKKFSFSPFEEFLYKFNNDFEFQLTQFRKHLFKEKDEVIAKVKAKQEASNDDWEAVRKAQAAAGQKKSIKKQETQEIKPSQRGFSYEFELRQ